MVWEFLWLEIPESRVMHGMKTGMRGCPLIEGRQILQELTLMEGGGRGDGEKEWPVKTPVSGEVSVFYTGVGISTYKV